jgi:hypothetical protein
LSNFWGPPHTAWKQSDVGRISAFRVQRGKFNQEIIFEFPGQRIGYRGKTHEIVGSRYRGAFQHNGCFQRFLEPLLCVERGHPVQVGILLKQG